MGKCQKYCCNFRELLIIGGVAARDQLSVLEQGVSCIFFVWFNSLGSKQFMMLLEDINGGNSCNQNNKHVKKKVYSR